jgi:hypothetical protein
MTTDLLASKGGFTPLLPPIYIRMTWRVATMSVYHLLNIRPVRYVIYAWILNSRIVSRRMFGI